MPKRDDAGLPEPLVNWLVHYDELLETGGDSTEITSGASSDPELATRFERARLCLDMIERVRQSDPGTHVTPPPSLSGLPRTIPFEPGERQPNVGRFEILGELGRGGYGVVFLAFDPQLDRKVALKVPRPEIVVTPTLRERFLREGKAVAGLNHAHLVPVFEAGSAGPICYLASAYCRGQSMAVWLAERDQPVEFDVAAKLMIDLSDAMQHAHSRGVVHRDLKPGNILFDEPESPGECPEGFIARITDFGLAKVAQRDSQMTRDGAILGTPSYMSPEQAGGRIEKVGPLSDVYSLGGVLYELLTRRPPFKKATDLATLRAVETEEPAPPRRLRADTPRDLEAICLKCLEKKPQNRYASASSLAADLGRFVAGEPVRARHVGSPERLWRWCKRNPVVSSLASVVVLLLVTLSVGSTIALIRLAEHQQRTREAKELAEEHLVVAEKNLGKAREAVETMLTEVGLSRLTSMPNMEPTRQRLLEEAAKFYEELVSSGDNVRADLRIDRAMSLHLLGRMNRWLGDNDKSLKYLIQARKQLIEIQDQEPDESRTIIGLASVLYDLGEVYVARSEFDNASESYAEALALHRADVVSQPDPMRSYLEAQTLNGIGYLGQITGGDPGEVEKYYHRAIAGFQDVRQAMADHVEVRYQMVVAMRRLAGLYTFTSRVQRAEQTQRQSLELINDLVEHNPMPDFRVQQSSLQIDLAETLRTLERHDEAQAFFAQGLAGATSLTRDFPNVLGYRKHEATALQSVGWTQYRMKEYEQARELLAKSVEISEQLAALEPELPDYQSQLANAQNLLALTLEQLQRDDESLAMLLKSLETRRRLANDFPTIPKHQSELGGLLNNVAMRHDKRGDWLSARTMFEEALQWQKKALATNPDHPTYHQYIQNHYTGLLMNYLNRDEFVKASELAVERTQFRPDSWSIHLAAARNLVRCVIDVRSHEPLTREQREELSGPMVERMENEIGQALALLPSTLDQSESVSELSWLLLRNPVVEARSPESALSVARRIVQANPTAWYAHGVVAAATLAIGSAHEAQSLLEEVVTHSSDARWQLFLAQAYARTGQRELARQRFEEYRDQIDLASSDMRILVAETEKLLADAP